MARLALNAAKEPFYNRLLPLALLAVLGAIGVGFTVANGAMFLYFGGEYRQLRKTVTKQDERIATLKREIGERKEVINSPAVATFIEEAKFAEELIEAKAFSWPDFLARLEEVKAYGVMLQSVTPKADKEKGILVTLKGAANQREELYKLEEHLYASPSFRNISIGSERKNPQSSWTEFQLTCEYVPGQPSWEKPATVLPGQQAETEKEAPEGTVPAQAVPAVPPPPSGQSPAAVKQPPASRPAPEGIPAAASPQKSLVVQPGQPKPPSPVRRPPLPEVRPPGKEGPGKPAKPSEAPQKRDVEGKEGAP